MRSLFGPGPQGLNVQPLLTPEGAPQPHHYLQGEVHIDPASLKRPGGGDPFLVLADGRTVRQVRADHAAELLLPEPYGECKFRLATDEEVVVHLAAERRKSEEYRTVEVARINREADEARRAKLEELDRAAELEAAKTDMAQRGQR